MTAAVQWARMCCRLGRTPAAGLLAASGVAWVSLAFAHLRSAGWLAAGGGIGQQAVCAAGPQQATTGLYLWNWTTAWLPMVVAMMFPLLIAPLRHATSASRAWQRQRATLFFLLGYLLLWAMAGIAAAVLTRTWELDRIASLTHRTGAAGAFLMAALASSTRARRRATAATAPVQPLRLHGWPASADPLRYGITTGSACLKTCWAPMAALLILNHEFGAMAAVSCILIAERYATPPTVKLTPCAWLAMAVWSLAPAL